MADLAPVLGAIESGAGAVIVTGIASQIVLGGQPVKRDTDGRYSTARNNTLANAAVVGICLNTAANTNQPIDIQTAGTVDMGTDLAPMTVGRTYVVSANVGKIAPQSDLASGNYVSVIGIATSGTNLLLTNFASGATVP